MPTASSAEATYAVYLEFRDKTKPDLVVQHIISGEAISSRDNKIVPFQVSTRMLTEQNPQRKWRRLQDVTWKSAAEDTASLIDFLRTMDLDAALDAANRYMTPVIGSFDSMRLSGNWELHGRPLIVGVSNQDVLDLQASATPRGLIDRIKRVRKAEGFPLLPGESA